MSEGPEHVSTDEASPSAMYGLLKRAERVANLGSWEWNMAAETWSFSDQWRQIHGVAAESLPSERLFEIAYPDDVPLIQAAFDIARTEGRRYDIEHRIVRADTREVRWVRAHGEVEYDPASGRPARMTGTVQDITDEKKARELYAAIFRSSTDGICVLNEEMGVVDCNEAYLAMSGYGREEISSLGAYELDASPADSISELAQTITRDGTARFETRHRRRDGSVYDVEVTAAALTSAPLFVASVRDISDRKRHEAELEAAIHEKDRLMQELNHRVKNNLQLIGSLVSLKQSASGWDLADIGRQVDAIRIIHERLNEQRAIESIEIRAYLTELLRNAISFSPVPVALRVDVDEASLPTRTAVAIGLIVNEIATNALKYGSAGIADPEFGLSFSADTSRKVYVLVARNNGPPIPDAVDFARPTTMGLRLVRELVAQLEGEVSIDRAPHPVITAQIPIA